MKTEILYEDKDILVVYKPAGVPTESASALVMDVVSELKGYLAQGEKKSADKNAGKSERSETYLGLIHRLDQPVEGILVFAKTPKAAADLSRQVADRKLKKQYLAAVYKNHAVDNSENKAVKGGKVTLTDYLLRDGRSNTASVSDASDKRAKKATLQYEVIAEEENYEIVKIDLETGRHHQIRVQMAHHGLPLLGDRKYGSRDAERLGEALGVTDVALCAWKLSFRHPITGKNMEFKASSGKEILRKYTV